MPIISIDHVQLAAPAGCEDAAREFFGRILDLTEVEKPEALKARGGCWFQIGPQQIHIGVEKEFRPATKAHPAFAVQGIDALHTLLSQNNIACTWDDAIEGVKRFYANDPWGNRLEFMQSTGTTKL